MMSRTLVSTLLLALLAAPMALAQHGPPPGYTDPTVYAQDYAAQQAKDASADPVGYAQSKDPAAEAEHTMWLACWTAYEAAGHALDAACAPFFTAPVNVEPDAPAVEAEITEVLNDTGVTALGDEVLAAVKDTVNDPASAVDQVLRIVGAVVRFVEDLIDFAMDTLGLGVLAIAAGVLGAVQGLLDLGAMPIEGLGLAAAGIAQITGALGAILGLAGSGLATASLAVGEGLLDGAAAGINAIQEAAGAAGSGLAAASQGVADGVVTVTSGLESAVDSVRDAVVDAAHKVGALFDGKKTDAKSDRTGLPDAPKTGTDADGLLDRLLGSL